MPRRVPRDRGGRRPQELRDQIVSEARGSARGTSGALAHRASLSLSPSTGPAGAVFSSTGSRDYY